MPSLPNFRLDPLLRTMGALENKSSRWLRNTALLLGAALLSAAAVFFAWQSNPSLDDWLDPIKHARAYLEAHPWALVLAVASLPGFGVPSSPLLILSGVVLGPIYGIPLALLITIGAQAFCTAWTYALAARPLRSVLKKLFFSRRPLPDLHPNRAIQLGLLLRLTPGVPYALQNIVLGLVGMRFYPYLLVSVPTTAIWATGFVLTGGAIFEGRIGLAITGLAILVALGITTRILTQKFKKHDRLPVDPIS